MLSLKLSINSILSARVLGTPGVLSESSESIENSWLERSRYSSSNSIGATDIIGDLRESIDSIESIKSPHRELPAKALVALDTTHALDEGI